MTRLRGERGAAAVEFAVIVPALVLLIGVMIGAGRLWYAQTVAEQIAGTASRAASLANSPGEAKAAAQRIASAQAGTSGLQCTGLSVDADVSGFQVPVGQPAQVRVRVTCAVPLAELAVPGWPGQWHIVADGSSALDRYRRRG